MGMSTSLTTPYAISYEVGVGLTAEDLAKGGAGVIQAGGATFTNGKYLGGSGFEDGGMTKTVRATFNRDTRTCHICSQTTSQDCKTTGSVSWFHNNRNIDCETIVSEEVCEDIVM